MQQIEDLATSIDGQRIAFLLANSCAWALIDLAVQCRGATGIPIRKVPFVPLLEGFLHIHAPYCYRCPFDKTYPDCDLFCLDFLDRVVDTESSGYLAGLIVEPYQGTSGFVFPPKGYMKRLEEWAAKRGLVFILDEVQSSYGRTGKMWALEHENLKPDILCLGKGLSSGYAPLAATIWE